MAQIRAIRSPITIRDLQRDLGNDAARQRERRALFSQQSAHNQTRRKRIDRILDRDSSLSRDDNKRAFQSLFNSLATGI